LKKFRIASVHYPTGMSWLLNCLVELDVCIYRGKDPKDVWLIDEDGGHTLADKNDSITTFVPSIDLNSKHFFESQLAVEFSHDLPNQSESHIPTIVFIRDPRDAVYSQFKRVQSSEKNSPNYLDYLKDLDPVFCLTPLETWTLFYWTWGWAEEKLILKFEDRFEKSLEMIQGVCSFLQIERTEREIMLAIEASSFSRARTSEHGEKEPKLRYVQHRSGQAREWLSNSESTLGAHEISRLSQISLSEECQYPEKLYPTFRSSILLNHRVAKTSDKIHAALINFHDSSLVMNKEDADLLSRTIKKHSSYPPSGSQTLLDLYTCGVRVALKRGHAKLMFLALTALGKEILFALIRRFRRFFAFVR
jgi:hypothetical protein